MPVAGTDQREAADAAIVAEVAAAEAAFIAAVAAALAPDESAGGVVTVTFGAGVVTETLGAGVVVVVAGDGVVVVVVVVDSFFVQAAKDTAAASETISSAVFMVLLGWVVR